MSWEGKGQICITLRVSCLNGGVGTWGGGPILFAKLLLGQKKRAGVRIRLIQGYQTNMYEC